MKKIFATFLILSVFSACSSGPVNPNFTIFWESPTQTFYMGEEVFSGEYVVFAEDEDICISPDPESVNLLPSRALEGTEPSFCISNSSDFLEAAGLDELTEGCFYRGIATIQIDSYLYDFEANDYVNMATLLDHAEEEVCDEAEGAY